MTSHAGAPASLMRPVVSRTRRRDAAKHYDEEQLAALVSLIALISAPNRLCVITRQPGGGYQPGQSDYGSSCVEGMS